MSTNFPLYYGWRAILSFTCLHWIFKCDQMWCSDEGRGGGKLAFCRERDHAVAISVTAWFRNCCSVFSHNTNVLLKILCPSHINYSRILFTKGIVRTLFSASLYEHILCIKSNTCCISERRDTCGHRRKRWWNERRQRRVSSSLGLLVLWSVFKMNGWSEKIKKSSLVLQDKNCDTSWLLSNMCPVGKQHLTSVATVSKWQ